MLGPFFRAYLWGSVACTAWATVPLSLADWKDTLADPFGALERWFCWFLILLPIMAFFIGGVFLLPGAAIASALARGLRQSNSPIPFRFRAAIAGIPVGFACLALVVLVFGLSWHPSSMTLDSSTWRPVLMAAGSGAAMGFGAARGIEEEA